MKTLFFESLAKLQFGPALHSGALTIYPVSTTEDFDHDYISLRQAFNEKLLTIAEISEGGSVPELKIINKGDAPILILAGEELFGAKQNRILNTTILVPPHSELIAPVSCTESGRWAYRSRTFFESDYTIRSQMKGEFMQEVHHSLRANLGHKSDQVKVWRNIERFKDELNSASPTNAMSDVYEFHRHNLDDITRGFPTLEGQCGVYVLLKGRFSGMEFVSDPRMWINLQAKILRSYAIDAIRLKEDGLSAPDEKPDLFALLKDTEFDSFKGVGLGDEIRLSSSGISASALIYKEKPAHLCVYPVIK